MPIPLTFTEAYAEAIIAADGGTTHYDCVVISSSMDANVIKLVNSFSKLDTPQGEYLACPFDVVHPEVEGEIVGTLTMKLSYLPKDARDWVKSQSSSGAVILIRYCQYLGEGIDPDFEYKVPFSVTSVDVSSSSGVEISATLPDLVNAPFCRRIMTKNVLPGLAG